MTHEELEATKARVTIDRLAYTGRHVIYNEIQGLIAEVERLTRENEALKKDVKENASGICEVCKYENVPAKQDPCAGCAPHRRESHTSRWEWRGIKEGSGD